MKKILDLITDEVTKAFTECGYDAKYAKVTLSNRPDLCEYQRQEGRGGRYCDLSAWRKRTGGCCNS